MTRVVGAITIRIHKGDKERLQVIAAEVGAKGSMGGKPAEPIISALLRMIASGELVVVRKEGR